MLLLFLWSVRCEKLSLFLVWSKIDRKVDQSAIRSLGGLPPLHPHALFFLSFLATFVHTLRTFYCEKTRIAPNCCLYVLFLPVQIILKTTAKLIFVKGYSGWVTLLLKNLHNSYLPRYKNSSIWHSRPSTLSLTCIYRCTYCSPISTLYLLASVGFSLIPKDAPLIELCASSQSFSMPLHGSHFHLYVIGIP